MKTMQFLMLTVFFGILLLLTISSSASSVKRHSYRIKRLAPKGQHYWTYLTKRNAPNKEPHYVNRRKRQYESEENEYYPPENTFYPYKNIGSLYVKADDVNIKEPMYNFGVEGYPAPKYPPIGVSSYESE